MPKQKNNYRLERIQSLILEELNVFITREVSDPRLDRTLFTQVLVNHDYSLARIRYTSGNDFSEKEVQQALDNAKGFLRSHLAEIMNTRTVPDLRFEIDKNIDHSLNILKILNNLDKEPPEDNDPEKLF